MEATEMFINRKKKTDTENTHTDTHTHTMEYYSATKSIKIVHLQTCVWAYRMSYRVLCLVK